MLTALVLSPRLRREIDWIGLLNDGPHSSDRMSPLLVKPTK
jgi:hypothetical protein